ncbi:MFS transporter [Streptomyces celluloflavus]|uniref:MFS transporter n=1 Tax=Streptomyces celluloflavus TaxID=58344 RepID=UPI0034606708|nr:MFS transporter [Streptomyces celluloflavus]
MTSADPEPAVLAPPVQARLFSRAHRTAVTVLAGGVALYAMNLYFTAALLPSVVDDIGGGDLYAWVATGFLLAAVLASVLVSRTLARIGSRGAYLLGFLGFALGAVITALAPAIGVLIAGRVVQGLGGGLLAGLGYAVLRSALPRELWVKGAGLISGMWGVGALIGPSVGGVFAEIGAWRPAYVLLAVCALLLAVASVRVLPPGGGTRTRAERMPVASLGTLGLSVASFSLISAFPGTAATASLLSAGVVFLFAFLVVEARSRATVFPRATFEHRNPLKWIYLLVAALCAGVMVETYVPLFGQGLGHLPPLVAGFLGATLSLGWVLVQLFSVRFRPAAARGSFLVAPLLLTASMLAFAFIQAADAQPGRLIAWTLLLVIGGVAIGAAFPHLSAAALAATSNEAEGAKAAAALNITQLIAYAIASSLAGVFVHTGGPELVDSARSLGIGLAALCAIGVPAGWFLFRAPRHPTTDA